jgi:hydroxymethylbilane synthase
MLNSQTKSNHDPQHPPLSSVRLGTRGSELAMWQARWTRDHLLKAWPSLQVEIVEVSTKGDQDITTPLQRIGQIGLFTHTLEQKLLSSEIDVAVHSLKDVPALLAEGCVLAAYSPREDPRDAWFHQEGLSLSELPAGARVATGSLRRRSQLLRARPDLTMVELRGNVNTRWRKFEEAQFDAMVLAVAGVKRMGWLDRVSALLEPEILLPAVGQGILGLEVRAKDPALELLAPLNDASSRRRATAERALLAGVAGGCVVPLAGFCVENEGELWLRARLGKPDGSVMLSAEERISIASSQEKDDTAALQLAYELGQEVAADLLSQGGAAIVDAAKKSADDAH